MISNTRVADVDGADLIAHLRQERPSLPIIYLANPDRSTPKMEADRPADVPILRVPFTADKHAGHATSSSPKRYLRHVAALGLGSSRPPRSRG